MARESLMNGDHLSNVLRVHLQLVNLLVQHKYKRKFLNCGVIWGTEMSLESLSILPKRLILWTTKFYYINYIDTASVGT